MTEIYIVIDLGTYLISQPPSSIKCHRSPQSLVNINNFLHFFISPSSILLFKPPGGYQHNFYTSTA